MTRDTTKHSRAYPFLFSPITLGPHTLKNRLVALPVHTGFARPDGRVSEWMIKIYARLAASGAAMVVVANTAVSPDGVVSRFNLRADRDKFIPGLARLASVIKSKGALSCIQLNHAGRFAKTPRPLLPSPIIAGNLAFNVTSLKEFMEFFPFEQRFNLTRYLFSQIPTWANPMTQGERERVIRDFGTAAARVRQAGFDLVELHGANGYLLCQYLSNFTNRLTAGFGGDLSSRAAFPMAVIREIKRKLPKNFPIGFRLLLREWVPGGIDLEQALAFARCMEKENLAYVSASAATYNSLFSPEVLKKMAAPAYLEQETGTLTRETNIPTIISGRITTAVCADRLIRMSTADLIGLGRPLRTDPGWLAKATRPDKKILPCINCNHCLKQVVLEKGFNCRQWPRWMQMQARLEHKMLTRHSRTLWIVAHPLDIGILKSYLPLLLPEKNNGSKDAILFLCDPGDNPKFDRPRQTLLNWLRSRSDLPGESSPDIYSIFEPRGNWENTLINEIDQGNHGQIFLAARPDQPWRKRLLYRTRGKITALLNTPIRPQKAVVLVDLSETTLLVIRVLGRTLMRSPLFSFDFIHVETNNHSGAGQVHTWEEARKITGLSDTIPLEKIRAETMIPALVPLIRKRGYGTIVMGKRGISGIKRRLLGSVSAGLLKQLKKESIFLID